jgi:hypothetical protein
LRACATLLTLTLFKSSVLPPISTEGLTTAGVGELSVCVREQMLQVLREISDPSAPPPPHDGDDTKQGCRDTASDPGSDETQYPIPKNITSGPDTA